MRLRIVALGHRMPAWVNDAVADYARRLPREYAFELVELRPAPRDRGRSIRMLLADEAQRVAAVCNGARIVALDERGAAWTTRQLADRLSRWRGDGGDAAFVIGSADGLDASIKQNAEAVVSLSSLTLPHGLVRVVLAEQLYRAATLLAGHPYHRE
jgi:23S rRNA (pseudouridine1915-N3)-methyltransferase